MEPDIRDIEGPLSAGPFDLSFAIAAVVVTLVMLAIIFSLKKRKKREEDPAPRRTGETAPASLEMLMAKYCCDKDGREYYARLSGHLRDYLRARFDLYARGMTSDEILSATSDAALLSTVQEKILRELLCRCDMVNFGKFTPEAEDIQSDHASAEIFIAEAQEASGSCPEPDLAVEKAEDISGLPANLGEGRPG